MTEKGFNTLMLTHQEKNVLIVLAIVIGLGSLGQLLIKKYPRVESILGSVESDKIYPKLNVNTASQEELVALPYIGEYSAETIINYRRKNGSIRNIEELKDLPGIKENNYKIFSKYLTVK